MVLLCGKDSKGFGGMLPLFFIYFTLIKHTYNISGLLLLLSGSVPKLHGSGTLATSSTVDLLVTGTHQIRFFLLQPPTFQTIHCYLHLRYQGSLELSVMQRIFSAGGSPSGVLFSPSSCYCLDLWSILNIWRRARNSSSGKAEPKRWEFHFLLVNSWSIFNLFFQSILFWFKVGSVTRVIPYIPRTKQ